VAIRYFERRTLMRHARRHDTLPKKAKPMGTRYTSVLAGDALEAAGFECADNAEVFVSLVDIDDAGNRSAAREQTFTVTDTMAPPVPGTIGLEVTGET